MVCSWSFSIAINKWHQIEAVRVAPAAFFQGANLSDPHARPQGERGGRTRVGEGRRGHELLELRKGTVGRQAGRQALAEGEERIASVDESSATEINCTYCNY